MVYLDWFFMAVFFNERFWSFFVAGWPVEGKNTWRTAQKDGREPSFWQTRKPSVIGGSRMLLFQGHSVETFLWAHPWLLGWGAVESVICLKLPRFDMPGSSDWTFLRVCHHVRLDAEGTWAASIPILAEMASNAASRVWNDFHMACIALLRRCGWHILELVKLYSYTFSFPTKTSPRFFNETWSTWNVQDSSTSSPKKTMVSAPAKPVHVATPGSMDRKGIKILKDCGSAKLVCIQGTRHFMYRLLVSYPDHLFAKMGFKAIQISISSLGQPWPTPLCDCYLSPPCQFFSTLFSRITWPRATLHLWAKQVQRCLVQKAKATTSGFYLYLWRWSTLMSIFFTWVALDIEI